MKDAVCNMNLLILCPGTIPKTLEEIKCFTDVLNYYLPKSLSRVPDISVEVKTIPTVDNEELKQLFSTMDVDNYSAIVTLGLRYYSKISKETTALLRNRFKGLLCQTYDGSRFDHDPVDITFTFKDDNKRLGKKSNWYDRHQQFNEYMGWAADPELNVPNQSSTDLRILVDHTNYGDNPVDKTEKVLLEIKKFVESGVWAQNFKSVSVRRFDSGQVVDVDLNNISYQRYDRSKTVPISEISKEHSAAHVFCVTHPESVGLVVLETATAGAFIVSPHGFIPADRLETVRYYEWEDSIDWDLVLKSIDPAKSREVALNNSWDNMVKNIIDALARRLQNAAS